MSKNKKHPECRKGERFLTNDTLDFGNRSTYKTLRRGKQAYNSKGEPLGESIPKRQRYPWFVSIEEYTLRRKAYQKEP